MKSAGNQNPIVLKTGTGGDEWSPNFFTADFSRTTKLPDLQYFRGSIEFIRPIEAFILDQDNEHTLRVRRRQEARESRRDQPTILRWFHYLADELVISLGGISHCLRTPAFKVEPFCEGVLFQLTADPFDADNPKHQEIQLGAMQHLGLIQ